MQKFGVRERRGQGPRRASSSCSTWSSCRAISAKRRPRQLSGGQKQRSASPAPLPATPGGHRRRAGLRARRLGAGGGDRAADGHPARPTARRCCSSATTCRVVRYLADRVVVMYLGQIMEQGSTDEVFCAALPPLHRGAALGRADRRHPGEEAHRARRRDPLGAQPAAGLPFHTRCHRKIGTICETEAPPLREFGDGHQILCHLPPAELLAMEPVIAMADPAPTGGRIGCTVDRAPAVSLA